MEVFEKMHLCALNKLFRCKDSLTLNKLPNRQLTDDVATRDATITDFVSTIIV